MLTRKYGAHLCYTPMIHAGLFAKDAKYRADIFSTCGEDRPLFAQFCANDPSLLLQGFHFIRFQLCVRWLLFVSSFLSARAAARHLEGKVDAIDLNFGCPQGIAKRGRYAHSRSNTHAYNRYGAFLLDKPKLLRALVSTLHNNLGIPVTCKMRMLPSVDETIKLARMLQDSGCSVCFVCCCVLFVCLLLVCSVDIDSTRTHQRDD